MQKAKHAFGSSQNLQNALNQGVIDAYDILFLDGDTDSPKVGWVDSKGKIVVVPDKQADLTELETSVSELEKEVDAKANAEEVDAKVSALEAEVATKANAEEVDAKISTAVSDAVESAVENAVSDIGVSYEKIKYEVADVPVGTLVNFYEREIRIMCKSNAEWKLQSVGEGGDANSYYCIFKVYAPSDDAVGYIEHLDEQVDAEILTSFSTDEYGRRYQPTWLAIAKYNEITDSWDYYGTNSTVDKYIGWDYQIDWYNADGVMIASDNIRINLSNEECHNTVVPSYASSVLSDAKSYVDEQIAKSESTIEIVEF